MDRTRRALLAAFAGILLPAGCNPHPAQSVVELHIASAGDDLNFQPSHLMCTTGARVRLIFHHTGEIISDPHNWVLLKPGTERTFVADAGKQADEHAVFDKEMILAMTPLCDKGKTVTVEFTAPAPGEYPFVCSIPGHGETMHGTLTVTA